MLFLQGLRQLAWPDRPRPGPSWGGLPPPSSVLGICASARLHDFKGASDGPRAPSRPRAKIHGIQQSQQGLAAPPAANRRQLHHRAQSRRYSGKIAPGNQALGHGQSLSLCGGSMIFRASQRHSPGQRSPFFRRGRDRSSPCSRQWPPVAPPCQTQPLHWLGARLCSGVKTGHGCRSKHLRSSFKKGVQFPPPRRQRRVGGIAGTGFGVSSPSTPSSNTNQHPGTAADLGALRRALRQLHPLRAPHLLLLLQLKASYQRPPRKIALASFQHLVLKPYSS